MQIYNEIDQGTENWQAIRAGRITASDFYTLMGNGETRKHLVYKKACERIVGKGMKTFKSPEMELGNELEPQARLAYELATGNNVEQIGFAQLNEYVGCSPDGLVGEDGIIEIKCPNYIYWAEQKISGAKKLYIIQIQFELYVLNRKWCDFVLYNEDLGVSIERYARNEETIELIKKEIERANDDIEAVRKKLLNNQKGE